MDERLIQLRKILGLTQTEIGERLGNSRNVIANLELGRVEFTEMMIRHICRTFGVSQAWFRNGDGDIFTEGGDDFVSELVAKYNLTPFQENLARIVYEMPVEHQEIILEYARRLLAESETETDEERTKRIVRAARAVHDAEEAEQTDEQA